MVRRQKCPCDIIHHENTQINIINYTIHITQLLGGIGGKLK